jgi:hypothetical protein
MVKKITTIVLVVSCSLQIQSMEQAVEQKMQEAIELYRAARQLHLHRQQTLSAAQWVIKNADEIIKIARQKKEAAYKFKPLSEKNLDAELKLLEQQIRDLQNTFNVTAEFEKKTFSAKVYASALFKKSVKEADLIAKYYYDEEI